MVPGLRTIQEDMLSERVAHCNSDAKPGQHVIKVTGHQLGTGHIPRPLHPLLQVDKQGQQPHQQPASSRVYVTQPNGTK